MNPLFKACLPILAAASLASADTKPLLGGNGGIQDPVLFSFAIAGDTRVDPTYPVKLDFPHFFNIVQVQQTLRDLAATTPKPAYLFITGDLVMGFARDKGATLKNQLDDFLPAVRNVPGLTLGQTLPQIVPLPGNHEMTFKQYTKGADGKLTMITGDDEQDNLVWRAWMHDNHFDSLGGNGPIVSAVDSDTGKPIKDDQSRMTYSFNSPDGSIHFVVINTDTVTDILGDDGFETEGLMPLDWVKKDLDSAAQNAAIKHIFVVGHKPVYPPANFEKPGKYDALHYPEAETFRQMLVGNPKVRAYLCSHAHLFHVDSLADANVADKQFKGNASARPVQIVSGNGGVDVEKFWHPEKETDMVWRTDETPGPYFGYALLNIRKSGKVTYNSYQRPVPKPYYGPYADPKLAVAKPRPMETEIK